MFLLCSIKCFRYCVCPMLRLHQTPPHPWSPLTDAEWAILEPYVRPQKPKTGRPARDRRATWDAIFWVACSDKPWVALPPELGRPDTTHSALIYAARNGILSYMLVQVSRHPLADPAMAPFEYRICAAYRRAARQLTPAMLELARNLGMATALPFHAESLPLPDPQGLPPGPNGVPVTPRIPRRALRGLPPPRLPKRPSARTLPPPVLLPVAKSLPVARRSALLGHRLPLRLSAEPFVK